jgi:hypothetical protein
MTPVPRPETRRAFTSAPRRLPVYDYGCAAFLHAKDHAIIHVGRDSRQKLVFYFGGGAQRDLDMYYQSKDHLNALIDRALAAANSPAEAAR